MLELQFQTESNILLAVAKGTLKLKELDADLERLCRHAEREGLGRILIDALQVKAPETPFQRHLLGARLAERLGDSLRVAILFPPGQITGFTEEGAAQHGASLLVTGEREKALAWLREGVQEAGKR